MTAVWIALGIVAAGVLFWLWAIAPSLPRADSSAFHRFDYAHRGPHDLSLIHISEPTRP